VTPEPPIPPTKRSDAELTAVVHERVAALRRRRRTHSRTIALAASATLVILVMATAAVAAGNGRHSERVSTADDTTATTVDSTPPTSGSPETSAPPTSAGPSITASGPTTTAEPPTSTSATTPTTATLAPCVASQFDMTLSTDKANYAPGETVTLTATMRNTGGACYSTGTPAVRYFCSHARAANASDKVVWDAAPCTAMTSLGPVPAAYTTTQTWTWDQRTCTGSNGICNNGTQVPAGPYVFTDTSPWWTPGPVTITIA
jgi:cytoskeletal protein RodZ